MEVSLDPDERTEEAMVQRIVALGFEIRVEFVLGDGTEVWAQLTRAELQKLELREGQIVYLRPGTTKSFSGDASPPDGRGASTPRGGEGGDTKVPSRLKGPFRRLRKLPRRLRPARGSRGPGAGGR